MGRNLRLNSDWTLLKISHKSGSLIDRALRRGQQPAASGFFESLTGRLRARRPGGGAADNSPTMKKVMAVGETDSHIHLIGAIRAKMWLLNAHAIERPLLVRRGGGPQ
jgi:hypothetical protein